MNTRQVLKGFGIGLAAVAGATLLVGAGVGWRVLARPPLATVPSTTHATLDRQACLACHAPIAEEWRTSFHYRSLTGPYWTQVRELGYVDFFDRVRKPCVNCHAPASVLDLAASARSGGGNLGVECTPAVLRDPPGIIPEARSDAAELGVDCTSCHVSRDGVVGSGDHPTSAHHTTADARFRDPSVAAADLCRVCHGSTVAAWQGTPLAAGGVTCLDCHMPRVRAASIAGGPERARRSHAFPADKDEAMLAKALNASLEIVEGPAARIRIVNDRVGHHFPSGGNVVSVRLAAYGTEGQKIEERLEVFGRDENLLLDFWPFRKDTRIPYGESREIRFPLPKGHGSVEAVFRYHDWTKVAPVIGVLRGDY